MKRIFRLMLVALMVSCMMMTVAMAEVGTTTGNVFVREKPDINAKALGTLPKGTEVYVEDYHYTYDGRVWAEVEYNGRKGYISDKYLAFESTYDEEVYNVSIPMSATGNVNVRSKSNIDSNVLYVLPVDSNVNVLALYPATDGRIWAEIDCSEEMGRYQHGYVSMKYLKPYEENRVPDVGKHMRVFGGRLNIREQPLITSRDIGTIINGTELTIGSYYFSSDGKTWAYVADGWDTHGFVSCAYLEKVD